MASMTAPRCSVVWTSRNSGSASMCGATRPCLRNRSVPVANCLNLAAASAEPSKPPLTRSKIESALLAVTRGTLPTACSSSSNRLSTSGANGSLASTRMSTYSPWPKTLSNRLLAVYVGSDCTTSRSSELSCLTLSANHALGASSAA